MTPVSEWLALLRVHEGEVTMREDRFFNHGQLVADFLAAAFAELLSAEYLALGKPAPSGHQQVCVTHAGQVRYTELNGNGARQVHHDD